MVRWNPQPSFIATNKNTRDAALLNANAAQWPSFAFFDFGLATNKFAPFTAKEVLVNSTMGMAVGVHAV